MSDYRYGGAQLSNPPQRGSSETIAGNAADDLYSFEKKTTGAYGGSGRTAAGRAPQPTFSLGGPRTGRMMSSYGGDSNSGGRPMTSVRAAGYSSRGRPGMISGQTFDPLNQGQSSQTQDRQLELSPEEKIKVLERKVGHIIEESAFLAAEGNFQQALDKAKEAGKKERQLSKQREELNLGDQINLDLTYCVLFNLANQYHSNKMYQEALNSYAVIVKNKLFNQSGRLRVNMGNIYFEQCKYGQAVKMYRMALDQIPSTNRDFRLKIMRNIGSAFIKMGQFQDAITSLEAIMEGNPDHHTGFNLILCYFAIGDKDKMKKGFQRIISIVTPMIEQNEDALDPSTKDEPIEDHQVFNEDALRSIARDRARASERYIIQAAKLISPSIDTTFTLGYNWVIDALKTSASNFDMASELEISKSIHYLKNKDFTQAIETLKTFEKKDPKLVGTAATNLSFLYFLEGDYKQSERYADTAIEHDRYNAKAQTNRGNCDFVKGKYDQARDRYHEAINVDAICTEAMYNLGLVYKRMNNYNEALQWFEKLHSILRSSPEVIYQIADIYNQQGSTQQAMEWFNILISVVPTDPSVLEKLGSMFERDGDKSQAFQYYSESYRYYPCNMDVISWLGAYYVDCEVYEQAIQFFERAILIQPNQVRWPLMIASCYRRSGNYQQAFDTYKRIHEKFPDNIECLRFLVRICTDLGMKEATEYASKLSRAEKTMGSNSSPPNEGVLSNKPVGNRATNLATTPMTDSRQSSAGIASKYNVDQEPPAKYGYESASKVHGGNDTLIRKLSGNVAKKPTQEDVSFQDDVSGLLPD
ncbi:Intraflagellar transport protein 88 [Batrachochytrium dendrobatidis]|nr:Intraflagellar transport protein 88 [Batrachochytrium dendrobatidis]